MLHARAAALIAALSLMTIGNTHRLSSQSTAASGPVVVAIVDAFPSSAAGGLAMRSGHAQQPDLVVLSRRTATPEMLAAGLHFFGICEQGTRR